jgi:HSP90 family molecular chaperone
MNTKMKIEKFNATPDTNLYGRLGKVGYSLRDAISELVDNSIDARNKEKKLRINVDLDEFSKEVSIKDNGSGMTKEEARDAIILGKSTKKGKLGFFGLGLKTAALSLGNILTIKTKQKNSNEEYLIEFDRNEFERLNNWELSVKSYPSNDDFTNGTEIIISDLLFNPTYKKSDRLNEYFAERYRSFINSGEIEIFVDGVKCVPLKTTYVMEEPISITTELGDTITGVLRIQTKRSQKHQEYGFNLYKNKRIIESFSKIGLGGAHGEKALICGDLNFDFCQPNYTKSAFIHQSDKYKVAAKALKYYLTPLRPLFVSKNFNREKIQKLLEIQAKTGKTPNLAEFKELIKSFDNEGEVLISETIYMSDINNSESVNKITHEEPARISRHTELLSQISSHLNYLDDTSRIINECKTDEETINEINSNSMTEMKLSSYSDSLIDLAHKIQTLIQKANSQKLASDSGVNTSKMSV